jgi:hypothetical protein
MHFGRFGFFAAAVGFAAAAYPQATPSSALLILSKQGHTVEQFRLGCSLPPAVLNGRCFSCDDGNHESMP